jgi:hypothetical protein
MPATNHQTNHQPEPQTNHETNKKVAADCRVRPGAGPRELDSERALVEASFSQSWPLPDIWKVK